MIISVPYIYISSCLVREIYKKSKIIDSLVHKKNGGGEDERFI
jgi:hypothetical protein